MALLSAAAIALLERLRAEWTSLEQLRIAADDAALAELKREHLAETQLWPPALPRHMRRRGFDESRSRVAAVQRVEVRKTRRGIWRLARIREARQR